jgi:formylglycine-generating enzyme required for sulfatase activity
MARHAAGEKSRLLTTVVDRCSPIDSCPVLSLSTRSDRHDADPVLVEERCQSEGGSAYCQRYRPAARNPRTMDTTTSHIGFHCVLHII